MCTGNRSSMIERFLQGRQDRSGRRSVRGRASRAIGRSAVGALTVLAGPGFVSCVGAQPASAAPFTPDEERIVADLPVGFSGSSCDTASSPAPGSVASLDCGQNAGFDAPAGGRFTLFADPDSMNRAFQNDLTGRGPDFVTSPCPGWDASVPAPWHYTETPAETAGQIFCGTFKGAPDIEWTRDRELLLLNVHDGPDLNRLFQWWDRFGNEPHEPIPFTR